VAALIGSAADSPRGRGRNDRHPLTSHPSGPDGGSAAGLDRARRATGHGAGGISVGSAVRTDLGDTGR
jgi:hypothetical protein